MTAPVVTHVTPGPVGAGQLAPIPVAVVVVAAVAVVMAVV